MRWCMPSCVGSSSRQTAHEAMSQLSQSSPPSRREGIEKSHQLGTGAVVTGRYGSVAVGGEHLAKYIPWSRKPGAWVVESLGNLNAGDSPFADSSREIAGSMPARELIQVFSHASAWRRDRARKQKLLGSLLQGLKSLKQVSLSDIR